MSKEYGEKLSGRYNTVKKWLAINLISIFPYSLKDCVQIEKKKLLKQHELFKIIFNEH